MLFLLLKCLLRDNYTARAFFKLFPRYQNTYRYWPVIYKSGRKSLPRLCDGTHRTPFTAARAPCFFYECNRVRTGTYGVYTCVCTQCKHQYVTSRIHQKKKKKYYRVRQCQSQYSATKSVTVCLHSNVSAYVSVMKTFYRNVDQPSTLCYQSASKKRCDTNAIALTQPSVDGLSDDLNSAAAKSFLPSVHLGRDTYKHNHKT